MNKLIKQAFTLIELLVVIAIIGILSGLIVVSMGGMTTKANIARSQIFSNSLRNALMLNLVSEWKLDQVNYPTTGQTPDTWGKNTGTLSGPSGSQNLPQLQTAGCVSGNCLSFDGTDDYIDCGGDSSLQLAKKGSIAMWFKPAVAFSGAQPNQKLLISGGPANFYFSAISSMLFYYSSDNVENAVSNSGSWDTNWHLVVVTSDGASLKMYIDAALQSDAGNMTGKSFFLNSGNFTIDRGANLGFYGNIDEVRLYNDAMPTSQIKEQYYAGLNSLLVNGSINAKEYSLRINSIAKNEQIN